MEVFQGIFLVEITKRAGSLQILIDPKSYKPFFPYCQIHF